MIIRENTALNVSRFGFNTGPDDYSFQHEWELNAPSDLVWGVLTNPAKWSSIIYGVSMVDSLSFNKPPVTNQSYQFVIKGKLPYSLLFRAVITGIEQESSLDAKVGGDLSGYCSLKMTEKMETTSICFDMTVSPVKPWMKFLAPVARKLFIHNHNYVVEKSYDALKRQIVMAMN